MAAAVSDGIQAASLAAAVEAAAKELNGLQMQLRTRRRRRKRLTDAEDDDVKSTEPPHNGLEKPRFGT